MVELILKYRMIAKGSMLLPSIASLERVGMVRQSAQPFPVVGSSGFAEAVVEMEPKMRREGLMERDRRVSKKWEKSGGHSVEGRRVMLCVLALLSKAGVPRAGQPICIIGRFQFPSSFKP